MQHHGQCMHHTCWCEFGTMRPMQPALPGDETSASSAPMASKDSVKHAPALDRAYSQQEHLPGETHATAAEPGSDVALPPPPAHAPPTPPQPPQSTQATGPSQGSGRSQTPDRPIKSAPAMPSSRSVTSAEPSYKSFLAKRE